MAKDFSGNMRFGSSYENASIKSSLNNSSSAEVQEWWRQKQMDLHLNSNRKRESHTDPTPLLIDKIAALPPGSPRRLFLEQLKGCLEGSTALAGSGMDSLTKESYRELKRLARHSELLQTAADHPIPNTRDSVIGYEEGKLVSNLQNWKSYFSNAVKPISEAVGSHADTNFYVQKHLMGPDQFLPQSATIALKEISADFPNEIENNAKMIQKSALVQTPSKDSGSIRQLLTCSLPINLGISFDLFTDMFNGVLSLINQVAQMIDSIINSLFQMIIGGILGLVDGLIPLDLIKKLASFVMKLCAAIKAIIDILSGLTSVSIAIEQVNNGKPLGCSVRSLGLKNTGDFLGKIPTIFDRYNKISNTAGKIGGYAEKALNAVNIGSSIAAQGFGNLATSAASKFMSSFMNQYTSVIAPLSNPGAYLNSFISNKLAGLMKNLPWCCHVGCTGDRGYSVADILDSLLDDAFNIASAEWSTHISIIGPYFNKQTNPTVGKYAQDTGTYTFSNLPFVAKAQGAHGVIMHGPGATQSKKVFRV
jgi:hypothetical protein